MEELKTRCSEAPAIITLPTRSCWRKWCAVSRVLERLLNGNRNLRQRKCFIYLLTDYSWTLSHHTALNNRMNNEDERRAEVVEQYKVLPRYLPIQWTRADWGVGLERSYNGSRVRVPHTARTFVLVSLCCAVLCRQRPCDGPITRLRSPPEMKTKAYTGP
jgi:hypothetical protein